MHTSWFGREVHTSSLVLSLHPSTNTIYILDLDIDTYIFHLIMSHAPIALKSVAASHRPFITTHQYTVSQIQVYILHCYFADATAIFSLSPLATTRSKVRVNKSNPMAKGKGRKAQPTTVAVNSAQAPTQPEPTRMSTRSGNGNKAPQNPVPHSTAKKRNASQVTGSSNTNNLSNKRPCLSDEQDQPNQATPPPTNATQVTGSPNTDNLNDERPYLLDNEDQRNPVTPPPTTESPLSGSIGSIEKLIDANPKLEAFLRAKYRPAIMPTPPGQRNFVAQALDAALTGEWTTPRSESSVSSLGSQSGEDLSDDGPMEVTDGIPLRKPRDIKSLAPSTSDADVRKSSLFTISALPEQEGRLWSRVYEAVRYDYIAYGPDKSQLEGRWKAAQEDDQSEGQLSIIKSRYHYTFGEDAKAMEIKQIMAVYRHKCHLTFRSNKGSATSAIRSKIGSMRAGLLMGTTCL
jgi:hypothetical protein